ncbi:neutral ceramidase isoform X2 [Chrysoperla carnea]|uniref:neutral ceramidase isoform X2 n=1 Tax=Chrysoperla carnea TaxID=189513 RepID=UPI001D07D35A|nr:neutral ceramidase isoform X2 [Chrysoperla carnea]
MLKLLSIAFILITISVSNVKADYGIGVGRADVTGPAAEVTFMGYARIEQKGQGIHLRQYSRAFIIEDGTDRIVFVSVDACMMGHAVREKVLQKLSAQYGDLYTEQNVIISGTHTHSTPGGFLMDFLFDISTYGFVKPTFNGLVSGIFLSIKRAHESITPGKIFVSSSEIQDANINRSPSAYLNNPESERAQYKYDVDKDIVQLKFVSSEEPDRILGAINWFAVHPTSMNYTNRLISSDNVGYASILLEKKLNPDHLTGRGPFVGAFASTNLGDVSPNIRGPRCQKSGNVCDILSSKCKEWGDLCVASGPGVDIFDSTQIIANRLYDKAYLLGIEVAKEVTGPLKIIHQYVDMPKQRLNITNRATGEVTQIRGCLPAMGYSFAAGTIDGPGPIFEQGQTTENDLWNYIRDKIAKPTADDIECHNPKPIFIPTGRMSYPTEWQPNIVATQLALIGNVAIAAVPGEFTTMSGRRLRNAVKEVLIENGADEDVRVIVGGLSNIYSDYIATPEEYQIQRYEGASTIYGPHTLTIYVEQYKKLANALMKNEKLDEGPYPPDLSKDLISLLPPVIVDIAPWRKGFGDCVKQPAKIAKPGDVVSASFVSGHPRNNLMHEKTFLQIERDDGQDDWKVVATDADWETRFIWRRKNALLGTSEAEIQWTIGPNVKPGIYRIRHFGYYKYIQGGIFDYEGLSDNFEVI